MQYCHFSVAEQCFATRATPYLQKKCIGSNRQHNCFIQRSTRSPPGKQRQKPGFFRAQLKKLKQPFILFSAIIFQEFLKVSWKSLVFGWKMFGFRNCLVFFFLHPPGGCKTNNLADMTKIRTFPSQPPPPPVLAFCWQNLTSTTPIESSWAGIRSITKRSFWWNLRLQKLEQSSWSIE